MVICDDVAVLADDHAGAAALALTAATAVAAEAAVVTEEVTQERVDVLLLLALLRLDGHLDVDDCLHGVLRRVGEIGIIGQ